jgi:hypothetical protein
LLDAQPFFAGGVTANGEPACRRKRQSVIHLLPLDLNKLAFGTGKPGQAGMLAREGEGATS